MAGRKDLILVAGSLYLAGKLRSRFIQMKDNMNL
jgi:folylpolyglutamate synthase/dihydropteroate synthase